MKSRQSNAGGRHHVQERSLGRKLQRLEADVQREEDYIDRIKKKIKKLHQQASRTAPPPAPSTSHSSISQEAYAARAAEVEARYTENLKRNEELRMLVQSGTNTASATSQAAVQIKAAIRKQAGRERPYTSNDTRTHTTPYVDARSLPFSPPSVPSIHRKRLTPGPESKANRPPLPPGLYNYLLKKHSPKPPGQNAARTPWGSNYTHT